VSPDGSVLVDTPLAGHVFELQGDRALFFGTVSDVKCNFWID